MDKRSKQLKKFLRDRKLLTRFKLNTQTIRTPFSFGVNYSSIGSAFVWKGTPEGYDFWSDLDYKFEEHIRLESLSKSNLAPNLIHALDAEAIHITAEQARSLFNRFYIYK